ncbi:MAG: hypothetical protein V4550_02325 [Gemmatimonadota bacterium]
MKRGGLLPSAPSESGGATLAYFDAVDDAYLRAAAVHGGTFDHNYSVAGRTVTVRFAGAALVGELTRAISHLTADAAADPDLTICVWDSESSGIALPDTPWPVQAFQDRREMWGVNGERVRVVYEFAEEPRLHVYDRERKTAILWAQSAKGICFYERAAPFFRPFHWALGERGLQLAHAAAVGSSAGGVLLGGKGGSGKSTTTLACLAAGLGAAGDDYVMLEDGTTPMAHSLYNKAKLFANHMRDAMPALLASVVNREEMEAEKAVVQIDDVYPGQLVVSMPIRAVLVPHITGEQKSELVESSSALGITAIAPSTVFQLRWAGREDFERIASVVRRVPNYQLRLGRNLEHAAETIARLLVT